MDATTLILLIAAIMLVTGVTHVYRSMLPTKEDWQAEYEAQRRHAERLSGELTELRQEHDTRTGE